MARLPLCCFSFTGILEYKNTFVRKKKFFALGFQLQARWTQSFLIELMNSKVINKSYEQMSWRRVFLGNREHYTMAKMAKLCPKNMTPFLVLNKIEGTPILKLAMDKVVIFLKSVTWLRQNLNTRPWSTQHKRSEFLITWQVRSALWTLKDYRSKIISKKFAFAYICLHLLC